MILDKGQYVLEANCQLEDRTYYIKLKEPIYLKTIPAMNQIIDSLHKLKFINDKQRLGTTDLRPRKFYILPKIHKPRAKWTVPGVVPPRRAIISDCGSEMDIAARVLPESLIGKTSLLHKRYLALPQEYPDPTRPDRQLLTLLELNLIKNNFVFNDEYYLQIKGTAMGKRFALSYANIYMAEWEDQVLTTCEKKPLYYYRYLNDIFRVWTHSRDDFDLFVNKLNAYDLSIQLKTEIDDRHKFSRNNGI